MKVSFIVVNYQTKEHLKNCVLSLGEQLLGEDFEIIVVNNEQESLPEGFLPKTVTAIEAGHNLGFAKACNLGAQNAKGEILFFLNPDTLINFSSKELSLLEQRLSQAKIGAVGAGIFDSNNARQSWSCGYELTLLEIIKNKFTKPKSAALWNSKHEIIVDWISGAAFAIKRDLFQKMNGFDEEFFMYFEDADLSKRLRQNDFSILCMPQLKIVHLGGASFDSKHKQKEFYFESQDLFFKKHYSPFSLKALRFLRKIFY